MNLQVNFGKNKNYHEKRTAHWYTVIYPLLKPHKQRLIDVSSLRLSESLYSRSVLFKRTNQFGFVFPNRLNLTISRQTIPPPPLSFFSFSVSLVALTFPSVLKTFLLFANCQLNFIHMLDTIHYKIKRFGHRFRLRHQVKI